VILLFGKLNRIKCDWQHSQNFVHNIILGNMELQNQDFKEFIACFQNRIEELVEGVKVNFIGYEDLITNKKASGRPKDLGDIDGLK
jgi:hypothetical protein